MVPCSQSERSNLRNVKYISATKINKFLGSAVHFHGLGRVRNKFHSKIENLTAKNSVPPHCVWPAG